MTLGLPQITAIKLWKEMQKKAQHREQIDRQSLNVLQNKEPIPQNKALVFNFLYTNSSCVKINRYSCRALFFIIII